MCQKGGAPYWHSPLIINSPSSRSLGHLHFTEKVFIGLLSNRAEPQINKWLSPDLARAAHARTRLNLSSQCSQGKKIKCKSVLITQFGQWPKLAYCHSTLPMVSQCHLFKWEYFSQMTTYRKSQNSSTDVGVLVKAQEGPKSPLLRLP